MRYPTLVGDSGDVEMASGEAILYFGSDIVVGRGGRGLCGVRVSFWLLGVGVKECGLEGL